MMGNLGFDAPDWLLGGAALAALAILAGAFAYFGRSRNPISGALWALRGLGILLLTLCLVEPTITTKNAKPGANELAILVDSSQRMRVRNQSGGELRSETAAKLFQESAPWRTGVSETYSLRNYRLNGRLTRTDAAQPLSFDGLETGLMDSLERLKSQFQNRPLAGVIFLTDGASVDVDPTRLAGLEGLPPVFPVSLGGQETAPDLAIEALSVNESQFEQSPFKVKARIRARSSKATDLIAEVIDPQGVVWAKQERVISAGDEDADLTFNVKPQDLGPQALSLRVYSKSERNAFLEGSADSEATYENNERYFFINRRAEPFRVLYVGGRPNWEFKFLNRALSEEPQINLVALVRVAKREPKFEFKGRPGETSNPFYRGFDKTDESSESYDEPVIKRLNVRDRDELLTGFPKVEAELFEYDAIILDDVEAEFFRPSQASMIERFVSDRGGGLAMLGGMESFRHGAYDRTPIGDVLPVYMDRAVPGNSNERYRWELTRAGALEDWARLRETQDEERRRLAGLPRFHVHNRVREVKPAAQIIATVTDSRNQTSPALVIQRYGLGRSAALLVGDLWRAGMTDSDGMADLYQQWRQFAQWLVAETPNRLSARATVDPENASVARLSATLYDPEFRLDPSADVRFTITAIPFEEKLEEAPIRIIGKHSETEIGVYEAEFHVNRRAAYSVKAEAFDSQNLKVGEDIIGLAAEPLVEEFMNLESNNRLVEQIATLTGGRLLSPDDLDSLPQELDTRPAPIMEANATPLWHTPWWFILAICVLLAEWGLRRWKGLS